MRFFSWLLLLPLAAVADEVVLDNTFVRVTRDGTNCVSNERVCGDRVIVALDNVEITGDGDMRGLARGDTALFHAGGSPVRAKGDYLHVEIKPDHPVSQAPPEVIAPEKNAFLHDAGDFFVFEEKLAPGDTRARHSHSQRVVIQLNRARLQQWPDGEPDKVVETVPDKASFGAPVVHKVKNVGDVPLRGIIVEFKPD
ncbi:MAG TPA: hypothetical protein VHB46_14530 [Burkholderiales bacterium]|nr:hypothetical protein [Burkholderiales bacterium]